MDRARGGRSDRPESGAARPLPCDKFRRRQVIQAAVRPDMIVALPPVFNNFLCLRKIAKPMLVQTFVADLVVEALGEAVLLRLARGDVMPVDPHNFIAALQSGAMNMKRLNMVAANTPVTVCM